MSWNPDKDLVAHAKLLYPDTRSPYVKVAQ